jgi:AcrR family transcriptional regulator
MKRDIVFQSSRTLSERDQAIPGPRQIDMQNPGPGSDNDASVAPARERIMAAILELAGEVGYRATDLEQLLARGEVGVSEFHRHFRDLGECFAVAYEEQAEDLCREMLAAARRRGEWQAGTEAALDVILRFAAARPAVTKALVREVHVAGGAALAKHEEVLERLAQAIGSGCEPPVEELATVPRAPSFVVGAVEGVIAGRLDRGEPLGLPAAAPELMYLIVASFLGRDVTDGKSGA